MEEQTFFSDSRVCRKTLKKKKKSHQAWDLSTGKVRGQIRRLGQPRLHTELEASLGYTNLTSETEINPNKVGEGEGTLKRAISHSPEDPGVEVGLEQVLASPRDI